jgi:hypothetical protein
MIMGQESLRADVCGACYNWSKLEWHSPTARSPVKCSVNPGNPRYASRHGVWETHPMTK